MAENREETFLQVTIRQLEESRDRFIKDLTFADGKPNQYGRTAIEDAVHERGLELLALRRLQRAKTLRQIEEIIGGEPLPREDRRLLRTSGLGKIPTDVVLDKAYGKSDPGKLTAITIRARRNSLKK